jgi:hypothetical protein
MTHEQANDFLEMLAEAVRQAQDAEAHIINFGTATDVHIHILCEDFKRMFAGSRVGYHESEGTVFYSYKAPNGVSWRANEPVATFVEQVVLPLVGEAACDVEVHHDAPL